MPAYSATFSDGSTKSIANSKREYAAAWRTVVQSNGLDHPTSFSGFSRDEATAWKAMRSERACIVNVGRWSKSGGTVVFTDKNAEARYVSSEDCTILFTFEDPFSGAVTNLSSWPEGLVLWHGGVIVWKSWEPLNRPAPSTSEEA